MSPTVRSCHLPKRARPPKMPNQPPTVGKWFRRFFPTTSINPVTGRETLDPPPKGYTFNGRGDLISLKRQAVRRRAAVRAVEDA